MGIQLPAIPEVEFIENLERESPVPLSDAVLQMLWSHYEELRRWNPSLSLIGPGTVASIMTRHYGESLAGLALLAEMGPRGGVLVDLGSGGGFPGFVLAAARAWDAAILIEARRRKWAFLSAAARRAGAARGALPCDCLNARVSESLPEGIPEQIDVLTQRALRLPRGTQEALLQRIRTSGRFLVWQTEPAARPPFGFSLNRVVPLRGSEQRCLIEYRRD